ncbi:MAG: dipeptidase [Gemmatimonadota bacterium]
MIRPIRSLVARAALLPLLAAGCRPGGGPEAAADRGGEDPALAHAREVLRETPVFDGHNDLAWEIRQRPEAPMDVDAYDLRERTPGHTDLARLAEGGVGAQFWSVYVPGEWADSGYARVQLEQIDIARRFIAKYPELELSLTADDVERAMVRGHIASLIGMEGGHVIENSLGALRAYYELGARYMTLTHNVTLDWADAANDVARHGGLTEFGRTVVREMNRLGMLVDLSHVSPGAMSDALDVSEAPVIFSHSSVRALADVPRNVPDSILRRLPANGGVVMVTFVSTFLTPELADSAAARDVEIARLQEGVTDPAERGRIEEEYWAARPILSATVADVADHVEHVRDVAGIDHVGIGADYDGMRSTPVGLPDVSGYPALFAELIRRGWSDRDLGKLADGNILRVLRAAEATARRLRSETAPSTAALPRS